MYWAACPLTEEMAPTDRRVRHVCMRIYDNVEKDERTGYLWNQNTIVRLDTQKDLAMFWIFVWNVNQALERAFLKLRNARHRDPDC